MNMKTPAHPGEVLLEDFLKPLSISVTKASELLRISRKHLSNIIHGNVAITADMAARIGALTNTSPKMWLGMQNNYDLANLDGSQYQNIACHIAMPSI